MKKSIFLFAFLLCYSSYSQSLSVFNFDASNFPTMKANFFAFDAGGKQITNLSTSDFEVMEDGTKRNVSFVSCHSPKPPAALSSVLVMDVSGSMCGNGLVIAKAAANAWIDMLPLGKSECAITSFSNKNYINQDFTTTKSKLVNGINSLACMGGTDYNAAMIDAMAGGVLIAKTGKNKRVIVFLSDGGPNSEPNTAQIIAQANANNIAIYCVTMNMSAPQCMKDFATQTGGLCFENIRTKEEVEECYRKILMTAQGGDPCQIEWQSGVNCNAGMTNVEIKLLKNGVISNVSYQSPNTSIAKLEFKPVSMNILNPAIGIKKDTTITVTARNADFNITNITSTNPAFTITPANFSLKAGQNMILTVSYFPADSGNNFAKFYIENDMCATKYYCNGGWKGKKATVRTLKLIHPNGGQVFVAGSDTVITWEGVLPDEPVTIEYRSDDNSPWVKLSDTATGMSYNFRVPKIASKKYLARVTAKVQKTSTGCTNGDVILCGKEWMGCNLDVDTYRNGDPIPEVQDPTTWANLTTGAWCYYNNDPANGAIYGKLYNWYAVNDTRGLAPVGWHVASDAEWTELENCQGGFSVAGGKLKTTGTIEGGNGLWFSPNTGATNSSGFSALPGGFRIYTAQFNYIGGRGCWWSSTERGTVVASIRYMTGNTTYLATNGEIKADGLSVRCVRDK